LLLRPRCFRIRSVDRSLSLLPVAAGGYAHLSRKIFDAMDDLLLEALCQSVHPELAPACRRLRTFSQIRKDLVERLKHWNPNSAAAAADADASAGDPSPAGFPLTPEEIAAAGERLLQLEEFEDFFKSCWPHKKEHKQAMRKLLVSGIDSLSSLRVLLAGGGRQGSGDVAQIGLRSSDVELVQQDVEVRIRPRLEFTEDGDRCVLVTAPHNIFLCRDAQPSHMMEEYTTLIAQRLSRQLSGCSLAWSRSEQYRSELNWFMAKSKGHGKPGGDYGLFLDPRNRDPNYLSTSEVLENPWFREMSRQASKWSSAAGLAAMLHVDVHGCRDPPANPSHLTVGLAAMLHHAETGKGQLSVEDVQAFGAALEQELSRALKTIVDLQPPAKLVRVLMPSLLDASLGHLHLSGAWMLSLKRHTQSQQAVAFAGFSHSCQLELSRSLRKALYNDETACRKFAKAINTAWLSALARHAAPSPPSPSPNGAGPATTGQRSLVRSSGTASLAIMRKAQHHGGGVGGGASPLSWPPFRGASPSRTAPASLRRSCPPRLRSRSQRHDI